MKQIHSTTLPRGFLATFCLLLALTIAAVAQTGSSVPVAIVLANQPIANEAHPGVFTVVRLGDTNATLNVWYDLGGTASNGVDYAAIPPHLVAIPAGARTNVITITPVNSNPTSIQTVILQLTPSPLASPVNYTIGSPSIATVYIEGSGVTNLPPTIDLVSPTNGETFTAPATIFIGFTTHDLDGSVRRVEFFAGPNSLGVVSNILIGAPSPAPGGPFPNFVILYQLFIWTNVPAGDYALTAVATDDDGASTTSAPVKIIVNAGSPHSNLPPTVAISSPLNGAVFSAPANISLIAKAADSDGNVTNVEFFANGADLGRGQQVVLDPPGVNGVTGLVYFFNWQNVPTDSYSLTAVATDDGGLSTTSAPVKITVQLPPTNRPPVVRITSPPNGSVFRTPANIPIFAYAADMGGSVSSVEFFADGTSLGLGHHVMTAVLLQGLGQPYPPPPMPIIVTNFWELTWTNPPPGTKIALTAGAADNSGLSTTSAPVLVSILPSPPPPTNRPPIVSIVATDPVAIEGTNCWTWPGLASPAATWSNWFAAGATFRLYTNCGPKDATISVFRSGATNDDLTVAYAIGGTASNGIGYVTLPGTVTIPAGGRRADITIVPLDDGPPDITSTVILKLAPGTNYLFGSQRTAAAIILESESPRAITGMTPGAAFNLNAAGPDGAWFHVECSTDLIHWTPICTNQIVNGSIDFVDPDAPTNPACFYRTVPEPGPPQ